MNKRGYTPEHDNEMPRQDLAGFLNLLVTLGIAFLLTACGKQDSTPHSSATEKTAKAGIVWQEGSESTHFYLGKDFAVKCWPLGEHYDCLYAAISDRRDQIADAPVYWTYSRTLPSRLPLNRSDFEGEQTKDGYACSTTRRGNVLFFTEEIWKSGDIAAENSGKHGTYESSAWSAQQVSELFQEYSVTPFRPYFSCLFINDLVQRYGLEILDTPVAEYQSIMQADRFEEPKGSETPSDNRP